MSTAPTMTDVELKVGDDDADAQMRYARTLLSRVALSLKLCTMHALDNAAMGPPIKSLIEVIHEGLDTAAELCLQVVGDNFFLNREIIKLDFSSYDAGQTLRQLLGRMGAQEIAFTGQPGDGGLRKLLGEYQRHFQGSTPTEILKVKFDHIRLRAITKAEEESLNPTQDPRKNLLRAYAQLALVIEAQLALMKAKKQARLARVRRAIHGLADACAGHEGLLIALTRFDVFSGQVRFHLASTTALTLLMCRKLALTRAELSEACMAAAFHDLALEEVPISRDTRDLAPEIVALDRVPLLTILRMCEGALGGDALERIAVAYEHAERPTVPVGFGQLVSVPCVFDRLTRPGPPRRGVLPDQALRLIVNQAGKRFDPRLVLLFTAVVGLYPVGTTVKLDSGEIGIVVEVSAQPAHFARPRIKVIRTAQGPADYLVDLAAPAERRQIVGSIDPSEMAINVPAFLLA